MFPKTLRSIPNGHLLKALPVPCSLQVFFERFAGVCIKKGPGTPPKTDLFRHRFSIDFLIVSFIECWWILGLIFDFFGFFVDRFLIS